MAAKVAAIRPPTRRKLRVYSLDPMSRDAVPALATLSVPFEPLEPGPVGSRLEVIDFDCNNRCYYRPVRLDDPQVAVQDGVEPDERDPGFHQQMTYAVAASVLEQFDRALGRRVRFQGGRRLRLFPHAFYGVNAFFDPDTHAVLFGFFHAGNEAGPNLPGQPIFACLSHDIIAHEVTHAVAHQLRPEFRIRTNPEVEAFGEAIADLVALLLHFKLDGILERVVDDGRTRIHDPSPLVELAGQFGYSRGTGGALRTVMMDPLGSAPRPPGPYGRAAVLVAAVFCGLFLTYEQRVQELVAAATGGSGILQPGHLHPALIAEVANETRQLSDRVLTVCIRAFDYLPPVDVTFGDFVRAVITADTDLFPVGHLRLRQNLIEGFRRYGIQPDGVWSLAESALRLETAPDDFPRLPVHAERVLLDAAELPLGGPGEKPDSGSASDLARRDRTDPEWARALQAWGWANAVRLGFNPQRPIAVRSFQASFRFDEYGQPRVDVVACFRQRSQVSRELAKRLGRAALWGGATVIADAHGVVRYVVSRPTPEPLSTGGSRDGAARLAAIEAFTAEVVSRPDRRRGLLDSVAGREFLIDWGLTHPDV